MTSNIYVDTFFTKKPHESIMIVQERLKDAMALDIEFAEYFRERAQIEDLYAKNLIKASRKLFTMDRSVLGHFAPVWESLIKEFTQVANIHSEMANRITEEIERPLRQSPSPNDYQRLQQLEPVIHQIDSHKNSLLSVKGSIFKKSSGSKSNSGSWQQEGLEYLQLHQKLDEARLKRLKTSTERFEQIQNDQLMKRLEMASMTMSTSEVFDIEYDIRDFCNERGKELSSGKIKNRSTRSNSEDNYHQQHQHQQQQQQQQQQQPKPNSMRPRAATMDSTDSHRSRANKIKSVFMKKKKHDKLEDQFVPETSSYHQDVITDEPEELDYQPPSTTTTERNDLIISTTVPVASPFMKSASTPINNNSPLIDNEGFSIPDANRHIFLGTSDISSQNTSEDVDSDYQSFQHSQKLHVNITDQVVKEDDKETSDSFNRMASMLREKTPTINKKPRGRRDTRSFTEPPAFNNIFTNPAPSDQRSRSNSVLSNSSAGGDSNLSNPFLSTQNNNNNNSSSEIVSYSPASAHSPTLLSHSSPISNNSPSLLFDPSWQLHSIQEVVHPSVDIVIYEKISIDHDHAASITGQIHLNYTASPSQHSQSSTPVSISIKPPANLQGSIEEWQVQDQVASISPQDKDTYILNSTILESKQGQHVPVINYKIKLDDGLACLPLQIHPAWKCTPDTSYLILKYNWNSVVGVSKELINGTVSVIDNLVTGVQSTPQGCWETASKKLTWTFNDILNDTSNRLLAKFSLKEQSEPRPIHLHYQYEASSSLTGLIIESSTTGQIEIKSIQAKVQSTDIMIL